MNPTNDGNVIRVAIPQLTEERRRDLVKQAKAKGEDARVSVRNIRRKAMEELHRIKKDGEAGEDEVKHGREGPRQDHPHLHDPDRRTGQAQRRRAAGGLVADQHVSPVTDTPVEEPPKKTSRAGRNLPAAIGVGVVLGAMAIGILLFAPNGWLPVLAVAIPIATYEVVRRLREAGYALPVIPLLVGGQAMIWLTWPYGAAGPVGRLRRDDRRVHGVAPGRAGASRAAGQLSARYFGHGAAGDVGAAVRQLQCAADLPGPRRQSGRSQ